MQALWVVVYLLRLHTSGPDYVLVIDAGSSGTRIYAYTWEESGSEGGGMPKLTLLPPEAAPNKVPRRALPSKRAYKRVETEPGLDAFVRDAAGLEHQCLGPLLEWAAAVVPYSAWKHTPVFLFGTAGLRRLNDADQGLVMENARKILSRSGLRFSPSWARILTGTDEGTFGWIALNLMAGSLAGDGSKTLGMLDLGGSSLEVAFALDEAEDIKPGKGLTSYFWASLSSNDEAR